MVNDVREQRMSRGELVFVVGITIVAAALRIYRLASWPLYGDEELMVYHIVSPRFIHIVSSFVSFAPLWAAIDLFGVKPWAMRLSPCFFGIISVPILYFLLRRMGGRITAGWGAGLLAIAPWHIAQSQYTKHYTEQALFTFLVVYAVYRAVEEDSRKQAWLSIVWGFLAIFTRITSVYMLAAVIAYLGLIRVWPSLRPRVVNWRRVYWLAAGQFALILVAAAFKRLYGAGEEAWGHSPANVMFAASYFMTTSAFLVAAGATAVGAWMRDRRAVILGLAALLPVTMITVTAVVFMGVGLVAFMSILPVVSIIGWSIAQMRERLVGPHRWLAGLVALGVIGAFAERGFEYFTFAKGYRAPLAATVRYLSTKLEPGDCVYYTGHFSFDREARQLGHAYTYRLFYQLVHEPPNLPTNRRCWFVSEDVYSQWDVPFPAREWCTEHARLMTVIPAYIGPRSHSIWVYRYDPPGFREADSTSARARVGSGLPAR